MRHFLFIPHLCIQNANAMSSPYTIGFPAMTAWLGAVHALQRKLMSNGFDVQLSKVAVSCHDFNLQTYKGRNDFVHSIIGTSNPLDKKGERPPFIEEPRCHLDVSILIEIDGLDQENIAHLLSSADQLINSMKFASGDVLSFRKTQILELDEEDEDQEKKQRLILNKLMFGHVLIERRDLVIQSMNEGKDALDAVLDYIKITHKSHLNDGVVVWDSSRKEKGWLVPIAVGFQGVSNIAVARNQRDANTPHRFAESIITLGEFVMPYRLSNIDQLFWKYHTDLENDLYLCQNATPII